MKTALILIILLLSACGGRVDSDTPSFVDRETTVRPDRETIARPDGSAQDNATTTQPVILSSGVFKPVAQRGSGIAAVVVEDGKLRLQLAGFEATRGADTRLYLATDAQAKDFIDLGNLQGYKGNYAYALEDVDLEEYDTVIVYDRTSRQVYSAAVLS